MLWNFSRSNRMGLHRYYDDWPFEHIGWWLSGRVMGAYVSVKVPKFWTRRGRAWRKERP